MHEACRELKTTEGTTKTAQNAQRVTQAKRPKPIKREMTYKALNAAA